MAWRHRPRYSGHSSEPTHLPNPFAVLSAPVCALSDLRCSLSWCTTFLALPSTTTNHQPPTTATMTTMIHRYWYHHHPSLRHAITCCTQFILLPFSSPLPPIPPVLSPPGCLVLLHMRMETQPWIAVTVLALSRHERTHSRISTNPPPAPFLYPICTHTV
ncbi:hypothetical protein K431DRAFT_115339 [Polychaeton citri CBS 116435]|uniref:Uncharacterized protein n=1 Tax=Polychaeton citri CBS 116435 TaxID=1314669 RepID=A0A9P4UTP9_9PEZI|nr:hypothetical protein K431DRAFT_115339 [Polychaeton citri CBS 116435]